MGILVSFLPFLAFAVFERRLGATAALAIGAVVAIALIVRGLRYPPHSPSVLEAGTAILMAGLALYLELAGGALPVVAVRFVVDAGLFLIVVATLAIGRPFTLRYARQHVDPALWNEPGFLRTNYVITGAWAAAFAVMAAAEGAMVFNPALPQTFGFAVVAVTLLAAIGFTVWYPARVRTAARA